MYKFKLFNMECGDEYDVVEKGETYQPILFDTIEEAIAFRKNPDKERMEIPEYKDELNSENWVIIVVEEDELKQIGVK